MLLFQKGREKTSSLFEQGCQNLVSSVSRYDLHDLGGMASENQVAFIFQSWVIRTIRIVIQNWYHYGNIWSLKPCPLDCRGTQSIHSQGCHTRACFGFQTPQQKGGVSMSGRRVWWRTLPSMDPWVHSCCHGQQGKSNDILANHSSSSAVMMSQFIIVIGLIQSFAGCLSCDYVQ